MKKIDWSTFKDFVDDRDLSIQYIEHTNCYDLWASDRIMSYTCDLAKNTSDATDFETNYKSDGNKKIAKYDIEGHAEFKRVIALDAMHYEPRSLDFITSKLNSLYNRKHDGGGIYNGTDYNDANMQFYDSSNTELVQGAEESDNDFQTRLTANCTKTLINFTPGFNYAIKSGILMLREEWSYDGYVWCVLAPHIPEGSGGQVPFLAGGYNMQFFPEKSYIRMDGETVFFIDQDLTYYSHRIGLIVKHSTGDQKGIQMIYEMYKE